MKILVALMVMMFSFGVMAEDCNVKWRVGNTDVDVLVCEIDGAENKDEFKALYAKCKSKCDETEVVKGNYSVETHCAGEREEGEFIIGDGATKVKGSKAITN